MRKLHSTQKLQNGFCKRKQNITQIAPKNKGDDAI